MKKAIKTFAVDFMEIWDEDPPLFFLAAFMLAFGSAILIGLGILLVVILVNHPIPGLITLAVIFTLCLIPACLFAYGKHVKANE